MIKTFENCSPEYQITIVCFFIFLTLLCMILVIYEGTGKRQRKMLLLDSVLLIVVRYVSVLYVTIETEYGVSGIVREKKDSYEPIFIRGPAVGVVLCILAVIPTIIAGAMETSDYCCGLSVGLLLFILAIGVNLLVRVGMVKSSYDTLLQEGEYTKEEKLFKKKTDTFSGVYWCLTTAIYLAWSFWTMSWDITWIVWPVAGVLFAALLGVVKMVLKNGSETQHYI